MRLNNLKTCLRFPCRGLNIIIDSINLKYMYSNAYLMSSDVGSILHKQRDGSTFYALASEKICR